jgi:2-polyprenyl-6-methoxyphenol hydroxylase-like FAD-dependent oxidoreductase
MAERRAIVIGGSMAGLCAARILSEFCDRVTVVDRDAYPRGAHERPGVPQSRHVHALLMRGRIELDALFTGFERMMLERGAIEINFGLDFAVLRRDGWAPRKPTSIATLFASRVLIEETVRGLLRGIPNVTLIERADVAGLEVSRNGLIRVTGVKVIPRDGQSPFSLTGDLVVDASGRATKAPVWIAELGLPTPHEEVVDSHTGYASRWYKAAPEKRPREWWWKGVWVEPTGNDRPEAGVIFPVEGNRFIVTLAGWGGKYPPSDEREFTESLQRLPTPVIAEEVALSDPISKVYSYRQMANRRRRYDQWPARLGGFVALGDSMCAFNPVYGQGMTSGAISALILRDCLRQFGLADNGLPRKFFKRVARFQSEPWGMATGADFRFVGTEGKRPLASRILEPVLGKMFEVQNDDSEIADRLGEVINMVKPPTALFEPKMLMKIARAWGKRLVGRRRAKPVETPMPPQLEAPHTLPNASSVTYA